MSDLILPDSPDPKSKNLINHERLELDPSSKSGIETLLKTDEGYIVGRLGDEILRFKTDTHLLTISPTGGGKTSGLIIPNLLDHTGSVFVIDIRGETVGKTATIRRLLGQKVVVIDPYEITGGEWGRDSYNPFDRLPKDRNDRWTDDIITRLTDALMFDPKEKSRTKGEAIWENVTRELLSGLITYCVYYTRSYKHSLTEIVNILNYNSSERERFIGELKGVIENDPQGQNDPQLKQLLTFLTETKATTKFTDNAFAQARNMLKWTSNNSFKDIIQDSTFSFEDMQDSKMTVYLVVPEQFIDNCSSWVRIMLESAVFSLKDVFSSKGISTNDLPQDERVLFLLDELPAFGQLDIVSRGMATLRGRGLNLWLFIQNMAQLEDTYGKEKMRTIIGNTSCTQVFRSKEVEELEYFSRVIGEDFFDIQTVSISETKTEGQTSSIGNTHTVSNSESISKAKGKTETSTKSINSTWQNSHAKSKNNNITRNNSYSKNENASRGKSTSKNKGKGSVFNRNFLASSRVSDNKNEGTTKGNNQQTSKGTQKTSGINIGEGTGETTTQSKGGGETTSNAIGTTETNTITNQKSVSDAVTTNESKSTSLAFQRSISVKQERMKIETVRSLRGKLSDRNQLLQIGNSHPFFIPRMSYFAKYIGTETYMFPDMASIVNIDVFNNIAGRLKNANELSNLDNFFTDLSNLQKVRNHISYWNDNNGFGNNNVDVAKNYRSFLSKDLQSFISKYQVIEQRLQEQRESFNEVAIASLVFINAMQNYTAEEFLNDDIELVNRMIEIENLSKQKINLSDALQKYQSLPLAKMDDNDFTKNAHGDILDETMIWLTHIYSPVISKVIRHLDNAIGNIKQLIQTQEDTRQWLMSGVSRISSRLDEVIGIAMDRELQMKHDFFMKRNMIE